MNQRKYLEEAQSKLEVGPTKMARLLDTPWDTYKAWLYERNPLPGIAKVAISEMTVLHSVLQEQLRPLLIACEDIIRTARWEDPDKRDFHLVPFHRFEALERALDSAPEIWDSGKSGIPVECLMGMHYVDGDPDQCPHCGTSLLQ